VGEETVHLVLDRALPCEGGLGIVLRGAASRHEFGRVVGGGRVLDALAPPLPRRRWARRLELRTATATALASGHVAEGLLGMLRSRAPRPLSAADVERRLGLEPGAVASSLTSGPGERQALSLEDHRLWTTSESMGELVDGAVAFLRGYHADNPHERAAPIETLRTALARSAGRLAAEHAVELALGSGRIRAHEPAGVCLPEFAAVAERTHDDATQRIRTTLDRAALEGASEREIIERSGLAPESVRATLARLATLGEARRLSGLWFGERRLADLRAAVRAHLRSNPTLSVPAFKQLFSVSRKQAIPLLEDLDQQGVTRRQGDDRVLGPAREK
jgi:selenocysteine-specific elongation factor